VFKKLFKGLKKVFKKVGKGIKKVVKGVGKVMGKIAKPFQKFGIVGQIALGFIMPWAIGSVFGGLTSTAFGTFAQGLTQSSNIFAKAAGYTFKGIHWGATKIKNAYNFVSDKISQGIETMTNKAKNLFGQGADASNLIEDSVINAPEFDKDYNFFETKTTEEIITDNLKNVGVDTATKVATEQTFGQKILGAATTGAISGIERGAKSFVFDAIAGDEGEGGSYGGYIADFMDPELDSSLINSVDFALQSNGYNYGGPSYQYNVQTSGFGQDEYSKWFDRGTASDAL
jgi:hypothetical protein